MTAERTRMTMMTLILIAALALLMAGSEPAMAGEGGGLDPCTAWAYGACGAGGCAPATRQWTRTCDPGEGPTAECRNDSSCCFYEDAPEGCGQGSCASTARRYKRTSNVPGCTPVSHWCQNEGSCGYVPPPPPDPGPGPLPAPPPPWLRYGFSVPGDPSYSFAQPSNTTKDILGLAAKGNIIIGDYTDYPDDERDFFDRVVPKLRPRGSGGITEPYVVDPTDRILGYETDPSGGPCRNQSPCFDGNYNQQDSSNGFRRTGFKLDGTERMFYESTLGDTAFRALVDPIMMNRNATTPVVIDAILYTNHALAGLVRAPDVAINGAMVARDDALVFNRSLTVNHDQRVVGDRTVQRYIKLPMSVGRPTLKDWMECADETCRR